MSLANCGPAYIQNHVNQNNVYVDNLYVTVESITFNTIQCQILNVTTVMNFITNLRVNKMVISFLF